MPPRIAAVFFVLGILGLFALARQVKERASKALWIPVFWLLIAGSRNVGQWLQMTSPMDQDSRYMDGNPVDLTPPELSEPVDQVEVPEQPEEHEEPPS